MPNTRFKRCATTLAMVGVILCGERVPGQGTSSIKPDETIQGKIRAITTAMRDADRPGGDQAFFAAILDLQRAARSSDAQLTRQLIWYSARATDVAAGMTSMFAFHYLRIPKSAMVEAVVPLMERTNDAKLVQAVREVTDFIEAGGSGPPDFSNYRGFVMRLLKDHEDRDSLAVVEHMYRRSAGDTIQEFALAAYQDQRRKPLLWARHVVDDAVWKRQYGFVPPKQPDAEVTKELEKMAAREEWWARLYAAAVLRDHKEFGTADLVQKLQADQHPLVQQVAKTLLIPAE